MTSKISPEIGQHFIVGLSAPVLSSEDRECLKKLSPLGVILRAHNFDSSAKYPDWLKTLGSLIDEVSSLTGRAAPIIALDHEGGRVHRTPPPLTHFPAACRYEGKAREVARAMAEELRSLGINLSFAPVADIHSNPKNPVIGERSFGSTPSQVARAAVEYARGLLEGGIIPVAKHFPGHGDTLQDSHEELPSIDVDPKTLFTRELIPFEALINAGAPAILTAHIVLRKFKDQLPATFSHEILGKILREKLQFKGVIITDDLDMKAIADNFKDTEIAEKALGAGCDILLFNHNQIRAAVVGDILEKNLQQKMISQKSFDESSKRIHTLTSTYLKRHLPSLLSAERLAAHENLRSSCA